MDALGEVETEGDRPLYPPRILSTEVVYCPFDDVFPREKTVVAEKAKPKEKVKKQTNLLSFGDEAEEEEKEATVASKTKIKSAHDVLNDERLSKEQVEVPTRKAPKPVAPPVDRPLRKLAASSDESDDGGDSDDDQDEAGKFDSKMKKKLARAKLSAAAAAKTSERDQRLEEMRRLRREIAAIDNKTAEREAEPAGLGDAGNRELLTPLEQRRQAFKQKRRTTKGRESSTLAKLAAFKSKVAGGTLSGEVKKRAAEETPAEQEAEKDMGELGALTVPLEDYDDAGWQQTSIRFEKDSRAKDPFSINRDDDYASFDPRKHKGKGKRRRMEPEGKWEKGQPLL
eukprot:CAMPEP_0175827466 /NCGR_PEP_ID=MMETSP0107_2-20121207/12299_1 /TAXON_ID=195067 ORGANISM="Goniomonas pacifica, Strain CCMP1869" /NCGR_SAMPLE_ID=MMETSP0107_2 /ASSEMBLY_ACC=CAM_ASM_000203 /LENGTH=340 /DNA_ID=CAMNT_0017140145 /DNA_START=176 /DNA_END=1198 /DNA_ORIENTATION=-